MKYIDNIESMFFQRLMDSGNLTLKLSPYILGEDAKVYIELKSGDRADGSSLNVAPGDTVIVTCNGNRLPPLGQNPSLYFKKTASSKPQQIFEFGGEFQEPWKSNPANYEQDLRIDYPYHMSLKIKGKNFSWLSHYKSSYKLFTLLEIAK